MNWGICRFIIGILFFSAVPVQAQSTDAEITSIIQSLPAQDLNARIEAASSSFLDRPYIGGPLGEGTNGEFDQDPLYRTDAFDCTTYVETVTAIALSHSLDEFQQKINSIRYANGNISYLNRNHFVEIDWSPNNEALGVFTDITFSLGKRKYRQNVFQVFDKAAWYQAKNSNEIKILAPLSEEELAIKLADLQNLGKDIATEQNYLAVIRAPYVKTVLYGTPVPAVINVVVSKDVPYPGMPTQFVTHQVLLVEKNGELRIRQASSRKDVMKVTDLSIEDFMSTPLMTNPALVGINVLSIQNY